LTLHHLLLPAALLLHAIELGAEIVCMVIERLDVIVELRNLVLEERILVAKQHTAKF